MSLMTIFSQVMYQCDVFLHKNKNKQNYVLNAACVYLHVPLRLSRPDSGVKFPR